MFLSKPGSEKTVTLVTWVKEVGNIRCKRSKAGSESAKGEASAKREEVRLAADLRGVHR